jgi:sec-independent protein translocase protein TatB
MFEIGWTELLLIAVVAIIVIGPKELPGLLRGFGRTMAKLRRSADDFRRQFDESVRESGYDDIRRDFHAMNPANQIRDSLNAADAPARPLSPSEHDAMVEAHNTAKLNGAEPHTPPKSAPPGSA